MSSWKHCFQFTSIQLRLSLFVSASRSSLNPVLYGYLDENFKRCFREFCTPSPSVLEMQNSSRTGATIRKLPQHENNSANTGERSNQQVDTVYTLMQKLFRNVVNTEKWESSLSAGMTSLGGVVGGLSPLHQRRSQLRDHAGHHRALTIHRSISAISLGLLSTAWHYSHSDWKGY